MYILTEEQLDKLIKLAQRENKYHGADNPRKELNKDIHFQANHYTKLNNKGYKQTANKKEGPNCIPFLFF